MTEVVKKHRNDLVSWALQHCTTTSNTWLLSMIPWMHFIVYQDWKLQSLTTRTTSSQNAILSTITQHTMSVLPPHRSRLSSFWRSAWGAKGHSSPVKSHNAEGETHITSFRLWLDGWHPWKWQECHIQWVAVRGNTTSPPLDGSKGQEQGKQLPSPW